MEFVTLLFKQLNICLSIPPMQCQPAEKTKYEVLQQQPMVVGLETSSYNDDVEAFLVKQQVYGRVKDTSSSSIQAVLLYGDEQWVSMIWNQMCENPDEQQPMWLLPFPGEFHFLVHITHAIYQQFVVWRKPSTSIGSFHEAAA